MTRIKPVLVEPDAVTATTTFAAINMENATKATFHFTRADHAAGSSKFELLGSADGTTFTAATMIQTIAADAGAGTAGEDIGYTRALSTTLAGDGTEIWALDLRHFNFAEVAVKVTETTDGTHSYAALIEY